MMVLLYIQNQDKQKMTKKKSNQVPRKKKKFRILLLPKTTPKIPQQLQKILPHATIFFLQVMNKNTRKNKKNNQKKTKQAREKEIMFLFLTPRFRKKRQLSCKIQGNTKSKLTRKNKNPAKKTQ